MSYLIAVACVIMSFVLSNQPAAAAVPPGPPLPATSQQVTATMMKTPLQFEANHGQVDAQVKFLARGKGYTLFLTPTESVMVLQQREAPAEKDPLAMAKPTSLREPAPIKQAVVRMKLEGANQAPAIDGMEKLPSIVNYFIGNDPEKWRTEIPTYAKVQYKETYPGIDLAYYGNQDKLEYDFIVAPGADPNQIKLAVQGASDIRVADSGDLLITTELGDLRMQQPIVYQLESNGHKTLVAGHYVLEAQSVSRHATRIMSYSVRFQLASYDHAKPVVIDPVLLYSTYLGGNGDLGDQGMGIAVDVLGQAYVTGHTTATDFPTTPGAFQTQSLPSNVRSAFVTKLNAAGTSLLYSTYLGNGVWPEGIRIAVDVAGQAYVTGSTHAADFPTTPGAFQTTLADTDVFITKLNAAGTSLLYSTFLGGNDYERALDIAVDGTGQAYVTGSTASTNFPTTLGAFQVTFGGSEDAFITKLNAAGTSLMYSTYLGGSSHEWGRGIAVDAAGQAYVTGHTDSTNFPTTPGAFQTTLTLRDVFVTKLSPNGTSLFYSTYLGGGGYDTATGIAIDGAGQSYVTGETTSTNFPITPGAFQTLINGTPLDPFQQQDMFVTKLSTAGTSLLYSTYLGGSSFEQLPGITVDAAGQAYVTGSTSSTNFPTTPGGITSSSGGGAFVTKLNAGGTSLLYSTFLGGGYGSDIALDAADQAYVTGTGSIITTPGAFQPTPAGVTNAFVAKISSNDSPTCTSARASITSLWDANGLMVPVRILGVTDRNGDAVTITYPVVTQDEPLSGLRRRDRSPDAAVSGQRIQLRAERDNNGDGRVYEVHFTATDSQGGSCSDTVQVQVPLNLRNRTAVDSGQTYNSFGP